jgi:hypothetical protein
MKELPIRLLRVVFSSKEHVTIEQRILDTNAGKNCLKLPQVSN